MSREEYIQYRNNNAPNFLYEYYKENHKGGIFLAANDFFRFIQMWPWSNEAFRIVTNEYDIKFEVMTISDRETGRIIKFI